MKYDIDNIKLGIETMFVQGDVVELRIPKAGKYRVISGYFNDFGKLSEAIARYSGNFPGVYVTLNPVNPDLLARANNHAKAYAESTTTDSPNNILRRRWFLVDIDPQRQSGISASKAEKQLAVSKAGEVREWLTSRNWALPLVADSGNGYHLLYRIDLPNTDDITNLVKKCLTALDERFSTESVKVDTTVFNASRISKAYGSLAAKGDSTLTRPHRLARILKKCNFTGEVVTKEQLEALAGEASARPIPKAAMQSGGTNIGPEKVEDFVRYYGGSFSPKRRTSEGDGWIWILRPCLLDSSHTGTSPAITLRDNGVLGWSCLHDSCAMGWKEFRATLEALHPELERFQFIKPVKADWRTQFADAGVGCLDAQVRMGYRSQRFPMPHGMS